MNYVNETDNTSVMYKAAIKSDMRTQNVPLCPYRK